MDGDLIQGTLQSLMQNRQQLAGQQQQAQQQHLDTMRTPLPQTSPIQAMVSDYLTKYAANPTMSWSAAASAAGAWPERQRQNLTNQLARIEAADAQEAKYAGENLKEADLFGSKLTSATRAGKGAGVTVKMDKDGNMIAYDPTTQETKVVHSSQRGEYQRIWTKAYQSAVDQGMENPEQYAHGVATDLLGSTQKLTTPGAAPQPGVIKPGSNLPKFEPLPEIPGMKPFEGAQSPTPQAPAPSAPQTAPQPLQYKNKPEEARKTELLSGDEKSARKDYDENIAPQAAAADSMLQALSIAKQIPRTQDMFAPYREKLGSAMDAVGMDGKMVREAQNLQQLRPILAKIANDRLLLAKGTQTEGDAQRAYNEFIKITDTQQAVDFMYAWTQELANRAKFKANLYNKAREVEGTWTKGKSYWDSTDYARAAPVAITKQGPKTYTEFRDQFIKLNKAGIDSGDIGADDILDAWKSLTNRGGK